MPIRRKGEKFFAPTIAFSEKTALRFRALIRPAGTFSRSTGEGKNRELSLFRLSLTGRGRPKDG